MRSRWKGATVSVLLDANVELPPSTQLQCSRTGTVYEAVGCATKDERRSCEEVGAQRERRDVRQHLR
eukprot:5551548-Pyramimonas_sp.AAC.1